MKENYMVCNCKKVSLFDIADVLKAQSKFDSVLTSFEEVQKVTKCSTGCGGCYDKVLGIISDIMMGSERI